VALPYLGYMYIVNVSEVFRIYFLLFNYICFSFLIARVFSFGSSIKVNYLLMLKFLLTDLLINSFVKMNIPAICILRYELH
jgi:hypothetical protein